MTKLDPSMVAALQKDRELREACGEAPDLEGDRRAGIAASRFWCADLPPIAGKRDITIPSPGGDIRLRIYEPSVPVEGESLPIVAVIHGGAFIVGSIEQVEPFAQTIAALTPAIVVSISYRLAPEHPFPAAIEDCVAAIDWIKRNAEGLGGDARRIGLTGISAGANLAVASYMSSQLEAQVSVLVYGVFLGRADTASHAIFGNGTYGLTTERVESAWSHYLPNDIGLDHPQVAVINGTLNAFPPTLLIAAECDPLLDDSRAFHDALKREDVPVELVEYAGMAHGFIAKGRMVPTAHQAITTASQFMSVRLKRM